MTQQPVQIDPLNSPFPVPWNWVLATQTAHQTSRVSRLRYYRTQALISPNGQYAAYSRIQMRVERNFVHSRVSSVLFIENLHSGDLQTVTASSPLANNPFVAETETAAPGSIAILIPVAWSAQSDRILAREFESLFGSNVASDFAVIWDEQGSHTKTLSPIGIEYTNAILLGWSCRRPDQVLFRAGMLGEPDWPLWAVDPYGQTHAVADDQPMTYGNYMTHVWAGPQAHC
ncbi:hypothetical protein ACQ4M4_07880 [Leptolyngbya sp. AN02str]|uniref:hypothetical protein n=1 Tax=Leptolyngbya sp. AN02str TaxID=3423363 RepID=UPI003D317932